jgi:hypothetical protein
MANPLMSVRIPDRLSLEGLPSRDPDENHGPGEAATKSNKGWSGYETSRKEKYEMANRNKKTPPRPHKANAAGRQPKPMSSGAVGSSGGQGKGQTSQSLAYANHRDRDEMAVAWYVSITLMHIMILWTAAKMLPIFGFDASNTIWHAFSEAVNSVREALFYVHAYLVAKTWWR